MCLGPSAVAVIKGKLDGWSTQIRSNIYKAAMKTKKFILQFKNNKTERNILI
jgi:hypothetical protein